MRQRYTKESQEGDWETSVGIPADFWDKETSRNTERLLNT